MISDWVNEAAAIAGLGANVDCAAACMDAVGEDEIYLRHAPGGTGMPHVSAPTRVMATRTGTRTGCRRPRAVSDVCNARRRTMSTARLPTTCGYGYDCCATEDWSKAGDVCSTTTWPSDRPTRPVKGRVKDELVGHVARLYAAPEVVRRRRRRCCKSNLTRKSPAHVRVR